MIDKSGPGKIHEVILVPFRRKADVFEISSDGVS